jgi:hypothetical protein
MGISRRGLFKGLFGLGAATVLAPVAKLLPAIEMKYRQPGISTITDAYFRPSPVFVKLFQPKTYSMSARMMKTGDQA